MKKHDDLDRLFGQLNSEFDIYTPSDGHIERFERRLARRAQRPKTYYWLSAAASVMLIMGLFLFFRSHAPQPKTNSMRFASEQTRQTDSVFTAMIRTELQKVKQKKNPVNRMIVEDALRQMKVLDADYEKIKQELAHNGESRQLIYAMIKNLQTRISFLEEVMNQIDCTEKLKKTTYENTL